jgi:hypothetical protein
MNPVSDDEIKQAQQGLCIWQTAHGLPWSEYCTKRATRGHLCREHCRDLIELYGPPRKR